MNQPLDERIPVNSQSEIPSSFASEDEEREWWATHDLTDAFYEEGREEAEIANLRFQQLKLTYAVGKLRDENQTLKERLNKIEAKLSISGN
jgi:hypothetical protein